MTFRGIPVASCLVVVLLVNSPVLGQQLGNSPRIETPPPSTLSEPAVITEEVIAGRQGQLEDAELSDDEAARARQLYQEALEQLQLAEQLEESIARWRQLKQEAPEKAQQLQNELAKPPEPLQLDIPDDATLADLDRVLAEARQEAVEAEGKLHELQREPARRADRRTAAADLAQAARQRISKAEAALAAPPDPGTPSAVVLAQQTLHQATHQASQRELEALEDELPAYDATTELVRLQISAAQRKAKQRQEAVQELTELVAQRRREEAEEQELQARIAAAGSHPALHPLAEENLELTRLRTGPEGLTSKIETTTEDLRAAQEAISELDVLQTELEEKLALPGMSAFAGPLLLQARSNLPHDSDLQRQIYLRNQEIAAARFQMADIRRRRSQLDDVSEEVDVLIGPLRGEVPSARLREIAVAAEELFGLQRQLLRDLEADYTTYFNVLIDVNAQEQALLYQSRQIRSLVQNQLMWVRGTDPISWSTLTGSIDALTWLGRPDHWRQVFSDALRAMSHRPLVVLVPLLLFALLFAYRRRLHHALQARGERAAASYLTPFRVTVEVLGLTLLLTLLWPALFFALGGCLFSSLAAADFTRALGAGLLVAGIVSVAVEFLRMLVAPRGLGESHFRWLDRRISLVRRNLLWLSVFILPLVVILAHIRWEGNQPRWDSLGRLLFVVGMVLIAVFMHRILRWMPPEAEEASSQPRSLMVRVVHISAVLLPILVACLSLAGFHFTAKQLALRLFQTACLVLVMMVLHGLSVRWLRRVRGSLALEQARQRRDARRQADDSETRTPLEAEVEMELELDLQTVNLHTRRLLQVGVAVTAVIGLWLIWLDVLPGAGLLDKPLWPAVQQVASTSKGTAAPDAGGAGVVTRGHLVLAVLVILTSLLASRNIPGLIEVSLPPSTPLDAGARYAISTMIRYLLIAAGIIFGALLIGIRWSNVQWLVAALSVGVGFGLQELVANFVSGLILLFERPVRVGDVVTIDGVTGTVTRVQIRATTVRNWDRQEYIVPNKDLITGRVLNWTLSSEVNRITVQVGVAYKSDARHVRQLLREILDEYPNVLNDPEPLVTFEKFGDSALIFVVRAYLANLDMLLETINDLHTLIHERFAEEAIEIALPQRDINIRRILHNGDPEGGRVPPLDVFALRREKESWP